MPKAIINGKLVSVHYGYKLPDPKGKSKKKSAPPPEEDKKHQLVLFRGERVISSRKTKIAKKPGKETYETDETPYGRINVINDDLTWRTNPVRKAHHDGELILTNKRLVHVVKQGWKPWAKYTTDFDRPLTTIQKAAIEMGDGWKRKFYFPGKRLAVQYYRGDVTMFGDTILAQRGGPPAEERKGSSEENESREREMVVAERRETIEERNPEKRRFHVRGDVNGFMKKMKDAVEGE